MQRCRHGAHLFIYCCTRHGCGQCVYLEQIKQTGNFLFKVCTHINLVLSRTVKVSRNASHFFIMKQTTLFLIQSILRGPLKLLKAVLRVLWKPKNWIGVYLMLELWYYIRFKARVRRIEAIDPFTPLSRSFSRRRYFR